MTVAQRMSSKYTLVLPGHTREELSDKLQGVLALNAAAR